MMINNNNKHYYYWLFVSVLISLQVPKPITFFPFINLFIYLFLHRMFL